MPTPTVPRHEQWLHADGRKRRTLPWLLLAAGVIGYSYVTRIRPWYTHWGATDAEVAATLPGDEFVPHLLSTTTRALTVQAPPNAIWPWLAQLGQERGGFYSYEWIENLLGCKITNANTVVPAWQHVQPGDLVKLASNPDAPPAYIVAQVIPNRALVLGHHLDLSRDPASPWADSWQFVIEPLTAQRSRRILRTRTFWGYCVESRL